MIHFIKNAEIWHARRQVVILLRHLQLKRVLFGVPDEFAPQHVDEGPAAAETIGRGVDANETAAAFNEIQQALLAAGGQIIDEAGGIQDDCRVLAIWQRRQSVQIAGSCPARSGHPAPGFPLISSRRLRWDESLARHKHRAPSSSGLQEYCQRRFARALSRSPDSVLRPVLG